MHACILVLQKFDFTNAFRYYIFYMLSESQVLINYNSKDFD